MVKKPPSKDQLPELPYSYLKANYPDQFDEYFSFYRSWDDKGQYLHFDELRRRLPRAMDEKLVWALMKLSREKAAQHLFFLGEPIQACSFVGTPSAQKTNTIVDQNTTTSALEWTIKKIGEEEHFRYFLTDLIEDESIGSSQLEGAATTTVVAKDMLKRRREPRNIDEKMILGNFQMMKFVWEKKDESLTPELIKELHFIGVKNIDNEKYAPGEFRSTDDVVVVDPDDNIVHQLPLAKGIDIRFKRFCDWINTEHDNIESSNYIHPLIKSICAHFIIGYEHPFRDGNGRVARALFYWFMFKKGYGAFRYISISNLLKEASAQYGKSYLYTETDNMDLTYFIDYQCSIILRAVSAFKTHCQKVISDIENFNKWLWDSGVYNKLSDKQRTVFQVAKNGLARTFTAINVRENLGCSYNTAAAVLNGLVDLQLFDKRKEGKEWIYSLRDKQEIQKNWVPPK